MTWTAMLAGVFIPLLGPQLLFLYFSIFHPFVFLLFSSIISPFSVLCSFVYNLFALIGRKAPFTHSEEEFECSFILMKRNPVYVG